MNFLKNSERLSGFMLKVIAIILMTMDHVGYCLEIFDVQFSGVSTLITVLRAFGRLALPLFCFLIVEGAMHTHNTGLYIAKLGIVGVIVMAGQLVCDFALDVPFAMGNIFIDLILGVLFVYLAKHPKKKLRWLVILPIAYAITSFVASTLEFGWNNAALPGISDGSVLWMPYFIRTQYGFYGLFLCIGFYFAYKATDLYYHLAPPSREVVYTTKDENGNLVNVDDMEEIPMEEVVRSPEYRAIVNICAAVMLILVTVIQWIVGFAVGDAWDFLDSSFQNYAMIAAVLLLFYSGKRGYDAKWFSYGCYAYYPLHLLIIYGVFAIVLLI